MLTWPYQPFLALAKSATSPAAAADLIQRATSAPNTFVFSELLHAPQIQAIRHQTEAGPYFGLLSQFCFGTYDKYIQAAPTNSLPPLNDAQILKLRQLSLLTHAKDPKNLTYKRLIQLLGLNGIKELEALVISAIYAGLLTATLDPSNELVCVSSVAPLRDVNPEHIPALMDTLQEWSGRCSTTLSSLEKQIAMIKTEALRRHKEELEWNNYVEDMVKKEGEGIKGQRKESTSGKKLGSGRPGQNSKRGFMGLGGGNRDRHDNGDVDVDMDDDGVEGRDEPVTRSQKKRGLGRGSGLSRP